MSTAEDVMSYTAWQLAGRADCAQPDSVTSPGADWLDTVRRNAVDSFDPADPDQDAHEQADAVVPIYTHHKWTVFTDLAAWQEDVTEFGPIEDLDQASSVALFIIADRLIRTLWDEMREEDDADDDSEDES